MLSPEPTRPGRPARASPGWQAPSGLRLLPVGLMHAASFPPPPPPPASLTRICARPLLPPLRELARERDGSLGCCRAAPPPPVPPRAPSPGSPPSARGAGVTRAKAAGLRAPGEEPACSVPELGIARRRRGEGGMRRERARGGLGRAGLHAPRRIPASASSGGKGMARAEEDSTANGKPARLHLSGTSRQAAARARGGGHTHVRAHIHRHTHARTRPGLHPDPSPMASGALWAAT